MTELAGYRGFAQDELGTIIPLASVTVTDEDTGSRPQLYGDRAGATAIGNPFLADAEGYFTFYVVGGRYRIDVDSGTSTRTFRDVGVGTASEYDASVFTDANRATVRVATTATITISTALNNGDTIDGVTLATNDRVLVKDQSSPAQNGVYVVGAVPARATDFDTYDDHAGAQIAVTAGTVNATKLFWGAVNSGGVLDTTAITFAEIPSARAFALSIPIGGPPSDGETVEGHVFSDVVTFPAGLAASKAFARVTATAEAVFNILHNDVAVGTVTFAIGASTGTFSLASPIVTSPGDRIDIEAPSPQDATLSGIKINLRGTK